MTFEQTLKIIKQDIQKIISSQEVNESKLNNIKYKINEILEENVDIADEKWYIYLQHCYDDLTLCDSKDILQKVNSSLSIILKEMNVSSNGY